MIPVPPPDPPLDDCRSANNSIKKKLHSKTALMPVHPPDPPLDDPRSSKYSKTITTWTEHYYPGIDSDDSEDSSREHFDDLSHGCPS